MPNPGISADLVNDRRICLTGILKILKRVKHD